MLKVIDLVTRRIIFAAMMKFWLYISLLLIGFKSYSQENAISGFVCNKEDKGRLAFVNIKNITTGMQVYDNFKGEFKIIAKPGDCLIISKLEYKPDTIIIKNNDPLTVYITRNSILLKEVSIHSSKLNAETEFEATKKDFSKIYGSLGYRDFLATPTTGGVGISIDAIWNSLSRSGRNAEKLRETIENDYEQNIIDFRFNKTLVAKITGLTDIKLSTFMYKYRPELYITLNTNDYEFASIIKRDYQRFLVDTNYLYPSPLSPSDNKY